MRFTAGWTISASTTAAASAGALVTTLMTPFGRPASRRTSPIMRWVAGQSSEALSTTVLPQAIGSATARVPRITGAFHGAMPTQTPAAWRIASDRQPALSDGMTSPPICVVIAAASRSILAASVALNRPQGVVAPVSRVIVAAKSSARAAIRSAAFSSSVRRAVGAVCDQAGKAAAAASTACMASSTPPAAAREATSPRTGSLRSKVPPATAGTS